MARTSHALVIALTFAACSPTVEGSPEPTDVETSSAVETPSPAPTSGPSTAPSPEASLGIPPLLADVPGYEVEPINPTVLELFIAAASASLGQDGELGDAVGARANGPDIGPVDLFAFTLIPAAGITENDALFRVMAGIAEGAGGAWVPDEAAGWFRLENTTGHSILVPWGNVPGGTVFLLLVGAEAADVENVANAILARDA